MTLAPALTSCGPDQQEKAETPPAENVAQIPDDQAAPSKTEDDFDFDGLPPGPGREEVFVTCSACHSLKLVQQQGLSQRRWEEILNWMVEEQGMTPLKASQHTLVINYLVAHYGVPE